MDGSLEADAKNSGPATTDNGGRHQGSVDAGHAIGVSVEGELVALALLETARARLIDGHGL